MAARGTFTTRFGGVSVGVYADNNLADHVGDDADAVARNRRAATAGLDAARTVFMRQVHGAAVTVIRDDTDGASGVDGVDALVTDVPGVALGVLVADCVPVVLVADRVVGVVHAGRRGMAAGVVAAAVAALRNLDDAAVTARVGPAICGHCYEVPASLQEEVASVVPQARCTTRMGTAGLDLRAGVTAQLHAAGVTVVAQHDACTAEDPAYFSYRRDGVTGRFAGLVVLGR